ncbi:MAG: stalk domain-containing protein [Peptostreptococcaceae bacterium]|nr:stalk domain-containing protein [Peptostreptococcaceae bacterium]
MKKVSMKRFWSLTLALFVMLNSTVASFAELGEKDRKASDETKQQLIKKADELLRRQDLAERFLGTVFLHGVTEEPGYRIGNDNKKIPEDAIRSTAWFNVWQVAAESKVLADSYTELIAQNKLIELEYYDQLYGFEMTKHLKEDSFYQGDFKTYTMQQIGGDIDHQAFYRKGAEDPSIRALFDKVGIFKFGNDLELTFAIDRNKARAIKNVFVNDIATIDPPVELGPDKEEKTLFLIKVPGEVKVENIVVTGFIYTDNEGKEKQVGPFGIDIAYDTLQQEDQYRAPDHVQKLENRVSAWESRGQMLVNAFLSEQSKIDEVNEVLKKIDQLKKKQDLTVAELYDAVGPIHRIENELTIQDMIGRKIIDHQESLEEGFYSAENYTKESLEEYKKFLDKADEIRSEKGLTELMELNAKLDKATLNVVLRYNIRPLKKLMDIANSKDINLYTDDTLSKFLTAKSEAKKWIEKMESYRPSLNETSDHIDALLKAVNSLVRKDGAVEPKINKKDLMEKEDAPQAPKEDKIYTVEGKFLNGNDWKRGLSHLAPMFDTKIKLVESEKDGNRIEIVTKPFKEKDGNITRAITKIQYNNKGRYSDAKILKKKDIEIVNKINQPIPVEMAERLEFLNIDTEMSRPMKLALYFYDKERGRVISEDVFLEMDFYDKKEGYTEPADPQAPPSTESKAYTVDVRFLNAKDPSKESHANDTLVQRAKLEIQGDRQTLTLKLKPMINREGAVSGVLTDLFYYKGAEKVETSKLDTQKIRIEFQGKSQEYTYPTAVSMPVDGKTDRIKCHMISGTPVFDEPHGDDVILWINYAEKSEGYNEKEVDKSQLSQLVILMSGPYYQSYKQIIPEKVYSALEQEIAKAKKVIGDVDAKEQDVANAVRSISEIKEKVDLYITMDTVYRGVDADFKTDEKDKRFSEESKQNAKRFIQDKKKAIDIYVSQEHFLTDEAQRMLEELRKYYEFLRYDVTELEAKIREAEEKISSRRYEEEGIKKLQSVLEEAKEYVNKAKNTKSIADDRAKHIAKLDKAIKDLVERSHAPKFDTTKLAQKIEEARAMIDSGRYTKETADRLLAIINEASAFIEDVNAGRATEDKSDMLIQKLTQGIQELKEKQVPPSDEVIVRMLDALLVKPDGSGNSMANTFMDKKVKVSYNKTKDQTTYEMVFNVAGLASSDVISDSTAAITSEITATVEERVDETSDMAEPKALIVEGAETNSDDMMIAEELPITEIGETATESAAMERAEEVAVTPTADTTKKVLEFWYKEGDDFKKIDDVETTAGKMTFRFMRSGKVAELTEMKVHIAALDMTHEVDLKLTIPSDFYGNADEKIKQAKEALQQSIERAQSIKEQDHEKDSYAKMSKALEDAKALIRKSDAKEQELKDAKAKLDEAIQGLKKKDDSAEKIKQAKEALQQSIDRAQTFKEQDHEKDSYAKMTEALEEAKALIKRSDAKEQELKDAKTKLDLAIQGLKKKSVPGGSGGSGAPGGSGGGSSSGNSNQRPDTAKKPESIQPNEVPLANAQSILSIVSIGSRSYEVTENGKTEKRMMDVAPMIVQGRTMLPIRVVSELLGIKVHYDHKAKIATFVYSVDEKENKIELFVERSMMKVNGAEQKLSAKPTNSKGRILIPLKDLQNAMKELGLHSDISWNADAKQVTIKKG